MNAKITPKPFSVFSQAVAVPMSNRPACRISCIGRKPRWQTWGRFQAISCISYPGTSARKAGQAREQSGSIREPDERKLTQGWLEWRRGEKEIGKPLLTELVQGEN